MLKRNTKYTALEILVAAGIDKVILPAETPEGVPTEYTTEEVFAKFSVNIGGIPGIADPNHIILISPETDVLVVSVAGNAKEVELVDGEIEHEISAGSREALDARVEEVPAEEPVAE